MHALTMCTPSAVDSAPKTEQQLISDYWLVSRCWNSYTLSKRKNMTSEKAIKLLGVVSQNALAPLLRRKAQELTDQIIFGQDEPDYLKVADAVKLT